MSQIFLIGFRGSGKSALGERAAKILELPFVDLDEIFREKFGDIHEFVAQNGWESFREKEAEILQEMENFRGICATGGGIIELLENREFLKNKQTIFIDVPIDELALRLTKKVEKRPRLEKEKDLETEIRENFTRRLPLYRAVATKIFAPDISLSKQENAEKLAEFILTH